MPRYSRLKYQSPADLFISLILRYTFDLDLILHIFYFNLRITYINFFSFDLIQYCVTWCIQELNLAVCGSQIVGVVPLKAIMEIADYFMQRDNLFLLEEDQKIRLVCMT